MFEPYLCVFPHADDEFANKFELQKWLLNDLVKGGQPGSYLLRKIGLKDRDFVSRVISGSLILFRKGEYIVGDGIAKTGINKVDPPIDGKYYNDIFILPESVHIYELPVKDLEGWCERAQFPANFTNHADIILLWGHVLLSKKNSKKDSQLRKDGQTLPLTSTKTMATGQREITS